MIINDDFLSELDEMLDICKQYSPLQQNGTLMVENAKPGICEMINFIIKEENQKQALLNWLNNTDFWTAPASTRFHGNIKGGLALHTYKVIEQSLIFAQPVFENFMQSPNRDAYDISVKDIFISALAHDFCKTGFYGVEYRNTKDITGNWIKQPFFKSKNENRNLGHGNESVLMLLEIDSSYLNKRYVLEAISRHMGFADLSESEGYNYSNFLQNPLVILLQLADQTAAQWFNC